MQDKVLILDFGSQYTQLIARRVRELNIFCEIFPYNSTSFDVEAYKAVILSGSPFSVRAEDAPVPDLSEIKGVRPLLGVCFGAQYIAHNFGGKVANSNTREYGRANLSFVDHDNHFFDGVEKGSQVWMSHSDTIVDLPENCQLIGSTDDVTNAAYKIIDEQTYGIQFHPEVYHTKQGLKILKNFLVEIAGIAQTWTPDSFFESTVSRLKKEVGNDKVLRGLSVGA